MQLLKIYKLAEKRNGNTVHADPSVLQGEGRFIDGNGRIGRALSEQILFKANLPNVQLSTAIERQRQSYYWELNKYGRDHQGNNISGWIDWFTTLVYKAIVREMVAEQEIEY